VFKNGSLARERVRDAYGLNWAAFSAALRSTPPGNGGALMLPWFDPEITPHVASPGIHRLNLTEADVAGNVRAIVEGQVMAMANHSRWMHVRIETIHATGGASGNADVLQVMADVFGATVHRFASGHSACLGAALRAWHADALASGHPVEWDEIVADLAAPMPGSAIAPRAEHVETYARLREQYRAFEEDHCGRT
jgi:xylulokinase